MDKTWIVRRLTVAQRKFTLPAVFRKLGRFRQFLRLLLGHGCSVFVSSSLLGQERARLVDPTKAKTRRRLVMGLREVLRGVKAKKVRYPQRAFPSPMCYAKAPLSRTSTVNAFAFVRSGVGIVSVAQEFPCTGTFCAVIVWLRNLFERFFGICILCCEDFRLWCCSGHPKLETAQGLLTGKTAATTFVEVLVFCSRRCRSLFHVFWDYSLCTVVVFVVFLFCHRRRCFCVTALAVSVFACFNRYASSSWPLTWTPLE